MGKIFISIISFCIYLNVVSQKIPVKKIDLDAAKWTFSNNEIDSYLNNIDSAGFLELFERVENENNGFKIPNTSELISLYYFQKTIPKGKIKESCNKYYKCVEADNLYDAFKLVAIGFAQLGTKEELQHPHSCKNCKNWSDEYKRKVACHVCKDERIYFCGKTVKCPICGGKGYYLKDTEEKSLNYESILKENSIKEFTTFLYFDSPNDFGIYNPQSNHKTKWYQLYFEQNAGFVLLNGKSTIQDELKKHVIENEKKRKEHEIQDKQTTEKIKSLLNQNKVDEAANEYSNLNNPQELLKDEIFEKIKTFTKEIIAPISDSDFSNFIKENKSVLNELTEGKHVLKSDNNGNITIDNSGKILGKLNTIPSRKYGVFEVFVSAQKSFEVTMMIKNNGNEKILSGTKNTICQKNKNGKYCKYKKDTKNASIISTTFDSSIPKNRLHFVQPRQEVKQINNFILSERTIDPKLLSEKKISIDFQKTILKTTEVTVVSALMFFGGLRIVEYLKIPN